MSFLELNYLGLSCDLIFNPKNSANCQAAADQLGQQISLLQQGLTLQEIRLLSDFSAVVKDGKGELGGQGIKFANLFEPFRTQAMAVDELSRQCAEKLQNGFGSEQEKNDFFKRLGTEAAQFGDSLANINLNAYEKNTPELEKKANDTLGVIRKFQQSYTLKEGVLKKAADMKDRILSLEQSKKWSGRVDLSSCYSALKNAGSKYLGAKDSEEYKNYREMMKTLKDVTVLSMKKRPNEVAKTILGDKCLDVIDKGTDYLKNIFGKS